GAHGLPPLQAQATATTPTGPLSNPHHGPVQDHPKVYLVFWGPNWYQDTSGTIAEVTNLFGSLAGGAYNNILSQYTGNRGDPANYLHTDSVLDDEAIDTTTPYPMGLMTDFSIGQEAVQALQDHGWVNTANTQVLVFPQQGTQYNPGYDDPDPTKGVCGDHFY